jgi:hypothetical protein
MPSRSRVLILLFAVALLGGTAFFLHRAIRPRVVARAVAADGTEMCIFQRFNWSPELFTTRFAFRKPGSNWGTFYYDHEDDYWGESQVALDPRTSVAVFYREGSPAITFDPSTEAYTLHRHNDTIVGPQWRMPSGWNPEGE